MTKTKISINLFIVSIDAGCTTELFLIVAGLTSAPTGNTDVIYRFVEIATITLTVIERTCVCDTLSAGFPVVALETLHIKALRAVCCV
jgi:hypothetical protein